MHSITHHEEEKEKMRKCVSKKQNRIQVLQWGQLPLKKQNRKWVLPAGGKWFRKRLSSNLVGMTMNALKPFDLEIPPPEIYLKAITMNVFKDLNVICNSNKKKKQFQCTLENCSSQRFQNSPIKSLEFQRGINYLRKNPALLHRFNQSSFAFICCTY